MACGSCGLQLSFGRKRRSRRSRRGSKRRSGRKSRRSRTSRHRRSKHRRSRHRRSRSRRSRSRRHRKIHRGRRFGIVAGPGFKAQTSYSNAFAPYFGAAEPFISASNWWYPYTGGVAQSPQMLMKSAGPMRGPGN